MQIFFHTKTVCDIVDGVGEVFTVTLQTASEDGYQNEGMLTLFDQQRAAELSKFWVLHGKDILPFLSVGC
jgi:hypothetical protein